MLAPQKRLAVRWPLASTVAGGGTEASMTLVIGVLVVLMLIAEQSMVVTALAAAT